MKFFVRNFIWMMILAIGFIGCSGSKEEKANTVSISGTLENAPEGSVLFEIVKADGVKVIDTLDVSAEGAFSLNYTVASPSFYRLNFGGRQVVMLILTGDESEVVVNAAGNDPRGFYEVSGSMDTELKEQMDELVKGYRAKMSILQQEQISARNNGDQEQFGTASSKMSQLANQTQNKLKQQIRDASPSLAAFYGIQLIDQGSNTGFIDSIATELYDAIPENELIADLKQKMEVSSKLAVGAAAPEISLPSPEGETITLSSLRGKYVLIDFWAAWCRPCRAENPNVVRMYNQFASENFEILGVSLDKTREEWLTAIEQDGLPWLHVSDLKFWRSEAAKSYQVSAIPATYLIDPEGKIIAKNLRGPSLEAKLRELFL